MKKITLFLITLFLFSCAQVDKAPKPQDLFSKQKMANVLTELYIVEGAISSNISEYKKIGTMPSGYLYNKYDMDSISFKQNLDYYTDRVDDYILIMDLVQDNLTFLLDSLKVRQERINKQEEALIPKNKL
jgi:hypothetical protein